MRTNAYESVSQILARLDVAAANPEIKPVELGNLRSQALAQGLMSLAKDCGIELKPIGGIDARGEYSIVVIPTRENPLPDEAGEYGEKFAAWLSTIPRRTGISPTSTPAYEKGGWCRVNHFDAEKLLRNYAEHLEQQHIDKNTDALQATVAPGKRQRP